MKKETITKAAAAIGAIEAAAVGIGYDELCDKIATLAYNKK